MMTLDINKQKMYYANQDSVVPIYERDEYGNIIYYEDEEGNSYPLESGDTKLVYGEPIEFFGNLSMSGGESEAVEFGLDLSQYSAVVVLPKNYINVTETSLIWADTEPTKDSDGNTDEYSADYRIVKISKSLNFDKLVLQKVVK